MREFSVIVRIFCELCAAASVAIPKQMGQTAIMGQGAKHDNDKDRDRDIAEGKRQGRTEANIKWLIRGFWAIVMTGVGWLIKKAAE